MSSPHRAAVVGLVTRVEIEGLMAQVELQSGPHRVVSLMSAEAASAFVEFVTSEEGRAVLVSFGFGTP